MEIIEYVKGLMEEMDSLYDEKSQLKAVKNAWIYFNVNGNESVIDEENDVVLVKTEGWIVEVDFDSVLRHLKETKKAIEKELEDNRIYEERLARFELLKKMRHD